MVRFARPAFASRPLPAAQCKATRVWTQLISRDFKATLQFQYGIVVVIWGSAVAVVFAAPVAPVMDHQTFVSCVLVTHRFQKTLAGVGAVTRVDVNVKRVQAPDAMVAAGLCRRGDFPPAK
jgi:hypothetical protein